MNIPPILARAETPSYIEQGDCSDLLTLHKRSGLQADLILFSPPYCNAIEYWRRHRLEYILGQFMDEAGAIQLKQKFIGRLTVGHQYDSDTSTGFPATDALLRYLVRDDRMHKARVLRQYFSDMKQRLDVFFNYLPRQGHCIIVVGDSTTAGRRIPTAKTLAWLAEQTGFEHLKTSRYKIKNRVMQFPLKANKRIDRESIILLRKM